MNYLIIYWIYNATWFIMKVLDCWLYGDPYSYLMSPYILFGDESKHYLLPFPYSCICKLTIFKSSWVYLNCCRLARGTLLGFSLNLLFCLRKFSIFLSRVFRSYFVIICNFKPSIVNRVLMFISYESFMYVINYYNFFLCF